MSGQSKDVEESYSLKEKKADQKAAKPIGFVKPQESTDDRNEALPRSDSRQSKDNSIEIVAADEDCAEETAENEDEEDSDSDNRKTWLLTAIFGLILLLIIGSIIYFAVTNFDFRKSVLQSIAKSLVKRINKDENEEVHTSHTSHASHKSQNSEG